MRRLLIVAYYYPPCARSGAKRPLMLARHLPECGWEPIVLTAWRPRCGRWDEGLDDSGARVFRTPELYPFKDGRGLMARAWRRAWNSVIPIDEHLGWVPFAAERGTRIVREAGVDAVLATGHPFSSFLSGLAISLRTGVPLFLDYRDPWLSNPHLIFGLRRLGAGRLERAALGRSLLYFGATDDIVADAAARYDVAIAGKGRTFPYGFDPRDHPAVGDPPTDSYIRLVSVGGPYDKRTDNAFLEALGRLVRAGRIDAGSVRIDCYANARIGEREALGLGGVLASHGALAHRDILRTMSQSHGLILLHGKGTAIGMCHPARMFEYLAARRPVLYLGDVHGAAARTIGLSGMGEAVDAWDVDEIEAVLPAFIARIRAGEFRPDSALIDSFEAGRVVRGFAQEMEKAIAGMGRSA